MIGDDRYHNTGSDRGDFLCSRLVGGLGFWLPGGPFVSWVSIILTGGAEADTSCMGVNTFGLVARVG